MEKISLPQENEAQHAIERLKNIFNSILYIVETLQEEEIDERKVVSMKKMVDHVNIDEVKKYLKICDDELQKKQ